MLADISEGKLECLWFTIGSYRVVKELDMASIKFNLIDKANFAQVALLMSVVRN
jgi:hypothetical protein